MKLKYSFLVVTAFLIACSGENSEEHADNSENVSVDTIDTVTDSIIVEDEIDPYAYLDKFSNLPEKLEPLRAVFRAPFDRILGEEQIELVKEEEWEKGESYLRADAVSLNQMEFGWLFIYYNNSGATALYGYADYNFVYFDLDGNYIQSVEHHAIDGAEVFSVHNKFFGFVNKWTEYFYEEDEEGAIIDGDDPIEHLEEEYYVCFEDEFLNVKNTDQKKWPFYRNRIYASKGYIFKTQKYTDYFSKYSWYTPKHDNVDHLLTEEEKALADYIRELENK